MSFRNLDCREGWEDLLHLKVVMAAGEHQRHKGKQVTKATSIQVRLLNKWQTPASVQRMSFSYTGKARDRLKPWLPDCSHQSWGTRWECFWRSHSSSKWVSSWTSQSNFWPASGVHTHALRHEGSLTNFFPGAGLSIVWIPPREALRGSKCIWMLVLK